MRVIIRIDLGGTRSEDSPFFRAWDDRGSLRHHGATVWLMCGAGSYVITDLRRLFHGRIVSTDIRHRCYLCN